MANDLLDRIRATCRQVSARAQWVHVDHDRLTSYARAYAQTAGAEASTDSGQAPAIPPPGPAPGSRPEDVAALTIQLNSINFGSGWHPVLLKRPGLSGARTVAAAFRDDATRRGRPRTAAELQALTAEDVGDLVQQDPHGPAADLVGHFTTTLRGLGELVGESFDGSFAALVESAGGSASGLVELLAAQTIYADEWHHSGLTVPLLKRAQITVSDLASAFAGTGLGEFVGLDRLTMFPDNLVPHVLRVDGVLRYDVELVARIDAGELLEPGEAAEVEIRACGVHAVELLVEHLRAGGGTRTAREIDEALWWRGAGATYKALPRHRCRTTAY